MNEEFEKIAKERWPTIPLHKRPTGEYMVDALNDCLHFWQASRKQALEEAANVCDEKWNVAPRGSVMCADAIRALQKE